MGNKHAFSLLALALVSFFVGDVRCGIIGERGNSQTLNPHTRGKLEEVTWTHNGEKVVEYDQQQILISDPFKKRVVLDLHTGALTIKKLNSGDDGVYESTVVVDGKIQYSKLDLQVIDTVPVPKVTCKEDDPESEDTTLVCGVDSNTPVRYRWRGATVYDHPGSELQLSKQEELDSVYTCFVKNEVSEKYTTFTLRDCQEDGIPPGVIAGIILSVIGVLCLLILIPLVLVFRKKQKKKSRTNQAYTQEDVENGENKNLLSPLESKYNNEGCTKKKPKGLFRAVHHKKSSGLEDTDNDVRASFSLRATLPSQAKLKPPRVRHEQPNGTCEAEDVNSQDQSSVSQQTDQSVGELTPVSVEVATLDQRAVVDPLSSHTTSLPPFTIIDISSASAECLDPQIAVKQDRDQAMVENYVPNGSPEGVLEEVKPCYTHNITATIEGREGKKSQMENECVSDTESGTDPMSGSGVDEEKEANRPQTDMEYSQEEGGQEEEEEEEEAEEDRRSHVQDNLEMPVEESVVDEERKDEVVHSDPTEEEEAPISQLMEAEQKKIEELSETELGRQGQLKEDAPKDETDTEQHGQDDGEMNIETETIGKEGGSDPVQERAKLSMHEEEGITTQEQPLKESQQGDGVPEPLENSELEVQQSETGLGDEGLDEEMTGDGEDDEQDPEKRRHDWRERLMESAIEQGEDGEENESDAQTDTDVHLVKEESKCEPQNEEPSKLEKGEEIEVAADQVQGSSAVGSEMLISVDDKENNETEDPVTQDGSHLCETENPPSGEGMHEDQMFDLVTQDVGRLLEAHDGEANTNQKDNEPRHDAHDTARQEQEDKPALQAPTAKGEAQQIDSQYVSEVEESNDAESVIKSISEGRVTDPPGDEKLEKQDKFEEGEDPSTPEDETAVTEEQGNSLPKVQDTHDVSVTNQDPFEFQEQGHLPADQRTHHEAISDEDDKTQNNLNKKAEIVYSNDQDNDFMQKNVKQEEAKTDQPQNDTQSPVVHDNEASTPETKDEGKVASESNTQLEEKTHEEQDHSVPEQVPVVSEEQDSLLQDQSTEKVISDDEAQDDQDDQDRNARIMTSQDQAEDSLQEPELEQEQAEPGQQQTDAHSPVVHDNRAGTPETGEDEDEETETEQENQHSQEEERECELAKTESVENSMDPSNGLQSNEPLDERGKKEESGQIVHTQLHHPELKEKQLTAINVEEMTNTAASGREDSESDAQTDTDVHLAKEKSEAEAQIEEPFKLGEGEETEVDADKVQESPAVGSEMVIAVDDKENNETEDPVTQDGSHLCETENPPSAERKHVDQMVDLSSSTVDESMNKMDEKDETSANKETEETVLEGQGEGTKMPLAETDEEQIHTLLNAPSQVQHPHEDDEEKQLTSGEEQAKGDEEEDLREQMGQENSRDGAGENNRDAGTIVTEKHGKISDSQSEKEGTESMQIIHDDKGQSTEQVSEESGQPNPSQK